MLRERLAAHRGVSRRAPIGTFAGELAAGAVHEWLAGDGADGEASRGWTAPLCVLIELARSAMSCGHGAVVWIGRACRPHAWSLVRHADGAGGVDASLLERSLLVDPSDRASALWAIDSALRSPGVCVVVADGRGMDMASTRRLQLGAESTGSVVLLARPLSELRTLSAAATRWIVRPEPRLIGGRVDERVDVVRACWRVELARSKGLSGVSSWADKRVTSRCVEWDHGACALVASPGVEHGPCEEAAGSAGRERLSA
jgi:protein ImuA